MSRVAPPQSAPVSPVQAGSGDGVVSQAMDDLSWMDADPAAGFADAMSDAGARQSPAMEESAQEPVSLADAVRQGLPAMPAAVDQNAAVGDGEDEKTRKPVDLAALSPALQPQIWQALMPRQAAPTADAEAPADAGKVAAPVLDAAPASPKPADKALQIQAADLAMPREAAPRMDNIVAALPPAHAADAAKAAESFSLALPPAQPESWSGKLQAALGERLQVLSSQNMDRATLRLDPPSLGTLEISLRHQAGALVVELTASHGEVVRQLQGIGDALRQDLGSRQYTQVAVEVREGMPSGQGQGGRQGREQQAQQQPGRALSEQGWQTAGSFQLDQG
ncbi:flagellar hook-length control protein FliK [Chromobacterium vaccinii]|nr:flagellar hook-length control protein FliK [Chromobacterium vaccinii]SUX54041.1 type III secretion system needle length determinant [Chromobacterium vaccinii]